MEVNFWWLMEQNKQALPGAEETGESFPASPCTPAKDMATMFKKHSRRNFRKKIVDEDDENGNDDQSENVPVVPKSIVDNAKPTEQGKSKIKSGTVASNPLLSFDEEISSKKGKSKSKVVSSSNSLLSFDDEVSDEIEVFKIKKSKESRRLAKRLEQERKKKDKIDEKRTDGDGSFDQRQDDTDEKLAALRAELSEMAGDEDAVLENDDVDSVGSGSVPHVQEPQTNSNTRIGAADISIPDAATIHAARKRREMARQTEQDFIPLDDTKRYEGQFASTGRLVREDENDISDSEGEEGAIRFSVARKRGFPALDRRKEVEAALANQELDEKSDNEEAEDEELKLWEDEQIRKGVKGVSVPLVQQQELSQTTETTNSLYQKPYPEDKASVYQLTQEQPHSYTTGYSAMHINGNQTYGPVVPPNSLQTRHAVTVDMICGRMKQQLSTVQEVHRGHQMEKDKVSSQLETVQGSTKKLERQGRNAEQRFAFFQEMRGYVRDLIECLNNKVGDTSMNQGMQGMLLT